MREITEEGVVQAMKYIVEHDEIDNTMMCLDPLDNEEAE
jgi:hypothetical protein